MRHFKYLSFAVLLGACVTAVSNAQRKPAEPIIIPTSCDSLEAGVFRSTGGRFSIAIAHFPSQIRESATEKAKAKGIDAGKMFIWQLENTLYTLYYGPPFDRDGNPQPPVYADMENGTRKGILNSNATLVSEKAITLGKHRGTEFRYISAQGLRYIGRIYLVGDMGYQVVGAYAEDKYEKEVLTVLASFKPTNK